METHLIGMLEPVDNNSLLLLVGDRPLLSSSSSSSTIMVDPAALSMQTVPQVETVRPYSPNIKSSLAAPENTLVPNEKIAATTIEENDEPSDLLVLTLTVLPSFVEVLPRGMQPIVCLPS